MMFQMQLEEAVHYVKKSLGFLIGDVTRIVSEQCCDLIGIQFLPVVVTEQLAQSCESCQALAQALMGRN